MLMSYILFICSYKYNDCGEVSDVLLQKGDGVLCIVSVDRPNKSDFSCQVEDIQTVNTHGIELISNVVRVGYSKGL